MARRHIMRIELTSPAKQKFSSVSERTGMTQLSVSSTLIDQFARQSQGIQLAILGVTGETPEATAKLLLKSLAETR
jgi:hypothetical protein